MRTIVKNGSLERGYSPNRGQRRKIQRLMGNGSMKKVTKEDVEKFIVIQRLRYEGVNEGDIEKVTGAPVSHYDDQDTFPDGTPVKLNYDAIMGRKADLAPKMIEWVEENKDGEFHLFRDGTSISGLVCLAEDVRFSDEDPTIEEPKWFFDLFSDLLAKNASGEWVSPWEIVDNKEDFVDVGKVKE